MVVKYVRASISISSWLIDFSGKITEDKHIYLQTCMSSKFRVRNNFAIRRKSLHAIESLNSKKHLLT